MHHRVRRGYAGVEFGDECHCGTGLKAALDEGPAVVRDIEKMFGFDKPAHQRFLEMLGGYLTFDFGRSLFRDRPVVDLIIEKMPVSVSLGLWSWLILVPAFTAYTRWWERTAAVVMSLYVLAAMLAAGGLIGAIFLWYYDRIA